MAESFIVSHSLSEALFGGLTHHGLVCETLFVGCVIHCGLVCETLLAESFIVGQCVRPCLAEPFIVG